MFLLIILFPLISFFFYIFISNKNGKGNLYIHYILLFGIIFLFILPNNIIFLNLAKWIYLDIFMIDFVFFFDNINTKMLLLVYIVSFIVHQYSLIYMGSDPHLNRFMSLLSLFTWFMIILVTGHNLIVLFIGWEGVGLCSYLLISFWNTRILANRAAFKAMFYNKIGDVFFLLGVVLLLNYIGMCNMNLSFINLNVGIFFLIAMMAKSAQMGLHQWLPDAMEGPTPVSALIHAATMVTAGVYLMIRLSYLFKIGILINMVIIIGSLTSFCGAAMALYQNDLKKIIAYSTCSQLGYMFLISGFNYNEISLFHLFNHGYFKALLFLSAGSVIHTNFIGEQDLRRITIKNLNIKIFFFLIGNLAITGFPFFTGFYSKDLILEIINQNDLYFFAFIIALIAALFTSYYSFKIFIYYLNPPQSNLNYFFNNTILISLIILTIFSILAGYLMNFILINSPLISNLCKNLPILVLILGILFLLNNKKIHIKFFVLLLYIEKNISYFFFYLFSFFSVYFILDNFILEKIGPWNLIKIRYISSILLSSFLIYFIIFFFLIFFL